MVQPIFTLRLGSEEDIGILTQMYLQLNEEFHFGEPMTMDEINTLMKNYLNRNHDAYIFSEENKIIGYSLVERNSNPLCMAQYFIIRSARGRGYNNTSVLLLEIPLIIFLLLCISLGDSLFMNVLI